jgi:hypothetical protein
MSRRCLAQATVNRLRQATADGGAGLSKDNCGLAPIGGRPPARCGEKYVGVRCGGRTTGLVHNGLEEDYTIIVTVTHRTNKIPIDRMGPDLMEKIATGFDDFVDRVRECIHRDHIDGGVSIAANTLLGLDAGGARVAATGTPGGPFTNGLQFLGDDDPYPVGDDWFWSATEGDDDETPQVSGFVQNLRFGRCKRVQSYISEQGVT